MNATPENKTFAERSTFLRLGRWLFSPRILKRLLLTLVWIASLVLLFYAFENWRGKSAWNDYVREVAARGEKLEMAAFVPAPVAPEQNFAATPSVKAWFHRDPGSGFKGSEDAYSKASNLADRTPPKGFADRRRPDLVAWAQAMAAVSEGKRPREEEIQHGNRDAAARLQAATSITNLLSDNRALFDELRAASARPHSVYPIDYSVDPPAGILLPHLARIKGVCQRLLLSGSAHLALGDTPAALADIQLILRLSESLENEPTLISQLVSIACQQIALTATWEGLADRRWHDAELQQIEAFLNRADFVPNARESLLAERAFAVACIDWVRRTRNLDALGSGDAPDNSMENRLLWFVPSGWFRFEQRNYARRLDEFMQEALPPGSPRLDPSKVDAAWQRILDGLMSTHRFDLVRKHETMSALFLPALGKAVPKFATAQVGTDQARLACALERHFLKHGSYPDSLADLAPAFLPKLPIDPLSGKSYSYARDGERYRLWSAGWNATDDGGTPGERLFDTDKGDWVWRYPAPK